MKGPGIASFAADSAWHPVLGAEWNRPYLLHLHQSPSVVGLTAQPDSTNRKEVEGEKKGEGESGLDVTSRLSAPPAEFQPFAFMPA